ncbi:MAG: cytochrome c oxidase subunit [Planctomycetota bacterium]|nr:MAG: cytochrome c oxidase subunit [Planctomycetota bacterium]
MLMRIEAWGREEREPVELPESVRAETWQTLTYLMIAGGIMLFTTFSASYLVRRQSADWAPARLPDLVWVNLAVVGAASVTMELARRGGASARRWLGSTIALGVLFVAGQAIAWRQLAAQGVFLTSSPHASFFYMLTAVHAAHVAAGLAVLLAALRRAGNGQLGLCAAWWHFVGAAWAWVVMLLTFF